MYVKKLLVPPATWAYRYVQAPEQDRVLVYATLPSDVIVPSNDPVHLKVPDLEFCTNASTGSTVVASKLFSVLAEAWQRIITRAGC